MRGICANHSEEQRRTIRGNVDQSRQQRVARAPFLLLLFRCVNVWGTTQHGRGKVLTKPHLLGTVLEVTVMPSFFMAFNNDAKTMREEGEILFQITSRCFRVRSTHVVSEHFIYYFRVRITSYYSWCCDQTMLINESRNVQFSRQYK